MRYIQKVVYICRPLKLGWSRENKQTGVCLGMRKTVTLDGNSVNILQKRERMFGQY